MIATFEGMRYVCARGGFIVFMDGCFVLFGLDA